MTDKAQIFETTVEAHRRRVREGWQCPECHTSQVSMRRTRFDPQPICYSCNDCGCQWDADYYPRIARRALGQKP